MDDNYQTFQKFNDPQLAQTMGQQLSELGIPFQIIEEAPNFNPSFVTNVVEPTIHLKLRPSDFERANDMLQEYYQRRLHDVDPDYYLLSFTDQELRDIIAKPDEWGHFDYALAKQLLADRGQTITADEADDLKQQRIRQLSRPEQTHIGWIVLGYFCAIFGGLFGLVIGYIFAYTKKTLPDGRTVPVYPHWARHHGKRIFFLAIAGTIFWVIIRLVNMRKPAMILLFVLVAAGANAQTSGNPIFRGWYADPEAAIFGRTYWVYPTYSAKYNDQVHFDAFSSTDLIHWQIHRSILDTSSIRWAKCAMWAPAITKKDDRYYFFFGANDIQNDTSIGGIGVAVADKPEGPYKDYLGHPLIDKFYNGAQPIDQAVFQDRDGQYYLIYGGWRHCNIARLKPDFSGFLPFSDGATFREITPEHYVEGPYMFRRNDKYYFMWSEGGWGGPDYSVAYAVADSPIGPFKRIGKILQQDMAVATGAGHHSILHVPGTDDYYIVYHRRPLGETDANHRVVCIDHMYFNPDGTIKSVKITKEGVEARSIRRSN